MTPPLWSLGLYLAASGLGLLLTLPGAVRRSPEIGHRCGVALVPVVVTLWLIRFVLTGHMPIFGAYESALSLVAFAGVTLLLVSRITGLPLLLTYPPAVAGMLYHGSRYSAEIWALTISERGFWVHLHAIASFVAFGLGLCLLAAAVLAYLDRNPPLDRLLLAFMLAYTLTIASGSFYRFLLFGEAWSFDPIESMNLACFLAFATLVHVATFRRWDARRTAGWTIICVVLLVLAYRLVLIFPAWSSYHILDLDLRMHVIPE